jgi:hypothetical protein
MECEAAVFVFPRLESADMATPEELAAAEAAKAQQEADAAKVAAEAKAKAEADAATKAAEDEVFDKERAMATINKLRETEKQAKKDAKELADLKAEAQKRADAELSETERLKKENERLASEAAQTKLDLMRRDAIDAAGLPAEFATRLHGATAEELTADAQALAKALPTLKVAPKVNSTNPANATQNETYAQQKERLFPTQGKNIFDPGAAREHGGGVIG